MDDGQVRFQYFNLVEFGTFPVTLFLPNSPKNYEPNQTNTDVHEVVHFILLLKTSEDSTN